MGIEDSPLRDRAIFVQGAPRSGTSWLVMLLATHPEIAGMQAESHLFEFGIDRLFDNFELRDPHSRGLDRFVEREELVDLARDLCDGVFQSMSAHVTRGPQPHFVVEKTPTAIARGTLDLDRKRECYPDGWYVHILRDGEAVTRSLMRAPFMRDRSEAACRDYWRRCVEATRTALGDHPRYREVSYEELREDPAAVSGELFRWLGADASDEVLETVRWLSRERFQELAVPEGGGEAEARPDPLRRAVGLARRVRGKVASSRQAAPSRQPEEPPKLAFELIKALREADAGALREITVEGLTLAVRTPEGDLLTTGDEARAVLLELSARLFEHRHASELWASVGGRREGWGNLAPGRLLWTVFFHGLSGDAKRVDLSLGLTSEDDRLADVVVLSAGPLEGRPTAALDPAFLGAQARAATGDGLRDRR